MEARFGAAAAPLSGRALAGHSLPPAATGCYEAARAAALAGVPGSVLYNWARRRVLVPSVSRERDRMWSWTDLIALRLAWLRVAAGADPGDPSAEIALALDGFDLETAAGEGRARGGLVAIRRLLADHGGRLDPYAGSVDLFGPFAPPAHPDGDWPVPAPGPDLLRPRPHLRIVPGKLSGEPHLTGSRLTTRSIAALAARGLGSEAIHNLFLDQTRAAITEAIDLEHQLAGAAAADPEASDG
jgi:uncharacterized protein (DUF433 family)